MVQYGIPRGNYREVSRSYTDVRSFDVLHDPRFEFRWIISIYLIKRYVPASNSLHFCQEWPIEQLCAWVKARLTQTSVFYYDEVEVTFDKQWGGFYQNKANSISASTWKLGRWAWKCNRAFSPNTTHSQSCP